MTKRYVIKLYYCPQEKNYAAIVYSFFLKRKEVIFTPDDVTPPKRFKGTLTTCFVKDYPLFIDPQQFPDIKHYNIIMGYNKPSDFELEPLNITPINRIANVSQSVQIREKVKKIN
ncbi:Transmembrane protein 70 homolog, mitochondrial [Anthophora retusa]